MSEQSNEPCPICRANLEQIPNHSFLLIRTDQSLELIESLQLVYSELKKRNIIAVVMSPTETIHTFDDEALMAIGLVRIAPTEMQFH